MAVGRERGGLRESGSVDVASIDKQSVVVRGVGVSRSACLG